MWRRPLPVLSLVAAYLFTPHAAAQDVEAPPPATPLDVLAERCATGKLDRAFEAACVDTLRGELSAHAANSRLPADFFEWLDGNARLRGDATAAMARVGPKVAANLQLLRAFDEKQVERYPALAVAFAAAWSRGADATPRRYWIDAWLVHGRDVPEMTESFLYHVERDRQMRVPLHDAPWQILAHLADSLVPIEERDWALDRYGKRRTAALRGLFGAVPYTLDPKRGDTPCTLESFLKFGGPCTHNVQFADGVFDAFGIPSGWAGGPGHTYPYWFEMEKGDLTIHRTNEIGNRNGKIRDPLGTGHVWEDRLRLDVAALRHSLEKERLAALAAWAYRRVPADQRAVAAPILLAAVRANPYCFPALDALADATRSRHLDLTTAGNAWKLVGRALADRPHDLPPLLDRALPDVGADAPTFDGDLALLATLERRWKKEEREALLARVPGWRARALAARGEHASAAAIWRAVARASADSDPERFAAMVDALADAVPGAPGSDERLNVLMAWIDAARPQPPEGWTTLHRSRFHVLRRVVAEYRRLGRDEEADVAWVYELEQARGADPGTGTDPELVGGDGGSPFEDAPAGAELVGVRVATTGYNGRSVIGCVEALFRVGDDIVVGERAGRPRSGRVDVTAPDGWRVAGMIAAGSDRLDGFQLVFVPRGATDPRVRLSRWIGSHREREILVGGRGVRITGIRGRAGADVDAMGLVGVAD